VPDKPFRYAIELPVEALWLRPIRVAAAAGEASRVSEQLTQVGLDLIRDVRQAFADVLLAHGQVQVAQEAVRIRGQISDFAQARLKAGDISPQEADAARVDALQARQDLERTHYDVLLSEERLRNLLALGRDRRPLILDPVTRPAAPIADIVSLGNAATRTRPDALAAEQSVAAATERLRLSRLSWVRLVGIGDATAGRRIGHELGPGFRVGVPIFDRGQGNIARAEAELERAERQRAAIHDQIILEVHQAHQRYEQARKELEILEDQVLPRTRESIQRAERAYREGGTPYVIVLESTRQILVSLTRRELLQANLRRARADLERSLGRRLDSPPPRAALGLPFVEECQP
jgi:cobalt-zinc-cadmium efflux system outer membrane protein